MYLRKKKNVQRDPSQFLFDKKKQCLKKDDDWMTTRCLLRLLDHQHLFFLEAVGRRCTHPELRSSPPTGAVGLDFRGGGAESHYYGFLVLLGFVCFLGFTLGGCLFVVLEDLDDVGVPVV